MKRLALPLLALALSVPALTQAHDLWILPSTTVLSGDNDWITVDAAVSDDKFFFNHRPLSLKSLEITTPAGNTAKAENEFSGKMRSGFDLHLTEAGTYQIAVVNSGLMARWKEDGKAKRWFGRAEDFAKSVPANASELTVLERAGRIETFVTKGKPSALPLIKNGIGLNAVTHPNDLFAGEKATLAFTVDGQPAKDLEVEIVGEGNRYRNKVDALELKTNDKGQVEVTWPHAGRYWLNIEASDDKTSAPQASKRALSYTATLEVLPQ